MSSNRKTWGIRAVFVMIMALVSSEVWAIWIPTPNWPAQSERRDINIDVRFVDTVSGKGVFSPSDSNEALAWLDGTHIELIWEDTNQAFYAQDIECGSCQATAVRGFVFPLVGLSPLSTPPIPTDATPGREYRYVLTMPNHPPILGKSAVNLTFVNPEYPERPDLAWTFLTIGIPVDASGWTVNHRSYPYAQPQEPVVGLGFNGWVMESLSQPGLIMRSKFVPDAYDRDSTMTLSFTAYDNSAVVATYPFGALGEKYPHGLKAFWCEASFFDSPLYPAMPDQSSPFADVRTAMRVSTAPPIGPVNFTFELEGYEPFSGSITPHTDAPNHYSMLLVPTAANSPLVFTAPVKALAGPLSLSASDWQLYQ